MKKPISLFEAILPLAVMFVAFVAGAFTIGMGTPLLVLVMLTAASVAGFIAVRKGASWDDIQRSTGEKLASVLPAILILLSIGMLIGTWMFSGTIPMLIYYGLQLINPEYMVLTAFLVTGLMSMCTGTSWGSAGTVGVVLMGVAAAVEAPLPATAGAVVSGAYFGDKLSPLSDSTNICAIGANANLYDHIRNMLYTAGPSFIIAILVYTILGNLSASGSSALPAGAEKLMNDVELAFQLNWPTLLPPVLVVMGIVRKYPPALTMVASSFFAMLIGIFLQGFQFEHSLFAAVNGFHVSMLTAGDLNAPEFSELTIALLNRGGLYSMVNTLLVIIAAFLLAAGMDVSGGLNKLLNSILARVRSVFGLIVATMASGAVMISLTSHGGVTALIVGGLFQDAYRQQDLAPENLSRSLEDSVTIVEPLMPWTVSAIFMATTLGVPTIDYLPWAIFCFTGPIFSLLWAAVFNKTGYGIRKL